MTASKTTSFIQPAHRIESFKPYFFASLNTKINQLRANGMDIIRLDMGSPDLPPEKFIVDALEHSARQPANHGYTPMGGTPSYRQAVSEYYLNRFDILLDPQTEVLALLGSKEGLFNLAQVLLNPGDLTLIPDPGYPVYSSASIIAGAEVYRMPLLKSNGFLPDLDAIPVEIAQRAKLMWLNYPNNPTGAIAPYSFYQKVVEFARKYHVFIANDAPYTDICFDNYKAPSILQIPGAKEVAVEFNSLSKTYNMAGWRLGMAVGNPEVIGYLHTYKSQADSSHFQAILDAGVAALTNDQTWIDARNQVYRERRDIVVKALKSVGFDVDLPPAAIYVWAKLPAQFADSTLFCKDLLEQTGVSTTPGVVYGEYGEGYLRISLGLDTTRIDDAMQRLTHWMSSQPHA
jgi:LL-diaminopimelate aminotransferase